MSSSNTSLTDASQDFAPARIINKQGESRIILVCEHASNHIPTEFNDLGLSEEAKISHIAWDPGALGVGTHMAKTLDAKFVISTVSRLVYDCNRPPEASGAMPAKSEIFDIPGNFDLTDTARQKRTDLVYRPFQTLLRTTIAEQKQPAVLVTIHSFTATYQGVHRDVEIGILHDDDTVLADAMLANAAQHTDLNVERNQPYGPIDGVTHTLQIHGIENGILNVMIEIRNDLIETSDAQKDMADILSDMLTDALESM